MDVESDVMYDQVSQSKHQEDITITFEELEKTKM
jgi:hypothetical protein